MRVYVRVGEEHGTRLCSLAARSDSDRSCFTRRGPAAFLTDSLTIIVLPLGWAWGASAFRGHERLLLWEAAYGLDCPLSHRVFALWSRGRHVEVGRPPTVWGVHHRPPRVPGCRQAECQAVPRGRREAVPTPLCPAAAQHLVHRRRDTDKRRRHILHL